MIRPSNEKPYDTVILGQGLAGSLLTHELLKQNQNLLVIDNDHHSSSSIMAAGLINPITGMRLVKTPHVELLLPVARLMYSDLEQQLDSSLMHNVNMVRVCKDNEEIDAWQKRSSNPDYNTWLGDYHKVSYQEQLNDPFGSFDQHQTAWLDVALLLKEFRKSLQATNNYLKANISDSDIKISDSATNPAVIIKHSTNIIKTKRLIFCQGYKDQLNSWFNWLPFSPAKGEILTLRSNKSLPQNMINHHKWVIPIDEFTVKTGSSWDRDTLDEQTTEEARNELLDKIYSLYNIPGLKFEVIQQQAGVRPCTIQRNPLVGLHPEHPQLGIFNGFGAKGSLLIPYYAQHFVKQLCNIKSNENSLLELAAIKQHWTQIQND